MKNLIFVFACFLSFNLSAQTAKQAKILSKANVDFIDNGIDYSLTFVPLAEFNQYGDGWAPSTYHSNTSIETSVRDALFTCGLDVGSYSQKTQIDDGNTKERTLYRTNIINGDYLVKIKDTGGNTDFTIEFIDMKTMKMIGLMNLSSRQIKNLTGPGIPSISNLNLLRYIFQDHLNKK